MEAWRPVVGFEDRYEVSDLGRIRRLSVLVRIKNQPARVLQAMIMTGRPIKKGGHLQVSLHARGKMKCVYVHRVVLEAFVGSCPVGMEACHRNDDATDNRLVNLRWDTRSANLFDALRSGRRPHGERSRQAKLTEAQVREIRLACGSQGRVAARYGVTQSVISSIKNRKTWKYLE